MRDSEKKTALVLCLLGGLGCIYLAVLLAPCLSGGLVYAAAHLDEVMSHPFRLRLCPATARTVLLFLTVYGVALGALLPGRRPTRQGAEHGSAGWGDAGEIRRRYQDERPERNKILTRHTAISLDGKRHMRNLNVLVCGGSGSGKTRFYAKPNVMNGSTSMVILDPKGEILRDTGCLLEEKGYAIRVLDLINTDRSHCYNPFVYLRTDNDIQRLVTNIFQNTTPRGARSQDPFWDSAASMLLLALVFYLHYEAPPQEQNFPMVMEMIRAGEVREDRESTSALDLLFDELEKRDPEHIALKYYRGYRSGSGKTLKSIQITLISRLEKYNLSSLERISETDEMDLEQVGERQTAIFAVIPENDASLNFLIGMLYTQLFQQLYYRADYVHGGSLPVHVHFVMDEFANVALPESFDKLLATMRSREISVSIIIQNMAQLKALFEKQWESIVGNCDEFLYLGGNEQSTHEYVSKLLGRETIETSSVSRSRGRSGQYSVSRQLTGRELMTPDEVRMLDNSRALLFIRGEKPVQDLKYDVRDHPNAARTAIGGGPVYRHGTAEVGFASLTFDPEQVGRGEESGVGREEYWFFCDEDLDREENKDKEEKDEKREERPEEKQGEGSREKRDERRTRKQDMWVAWRG